MFHVKTKKCQVCLEDGEKAYYPEGNSRPFAVVYLCIHEHTHMYIHPRMVSTNLFELCSKNERRKHIVWYMSIHFLRAYPTNAGNYSFCSGKYRWRKGISLPAQ